MSRKTETWCSNDSFLSNSNYNLNQYNSIHQEREGKRGGGVCVYINKKYNLNIELIFQPLMRITKLYLYK